MRERGVKKSLVKCDLTMEEKIKKKEGMVKD
jgi:hypothetical protein